MNLTLCLSNGYPLNTLAVTNYRPRGKQYYRLGGMFIQEWKMSDHVPLNPEQHIIFQSSIAEPFPNTPAEPDELGDISLLYPRPVHLQLGSLGQ